MYCIHGGIFYDPDKDEYPDCSGKTAKERQARAVEVQISKFLEKVYLMAEGGIKLQLWIVRIQDTNHDLTCNYAVAARSQAEAKETARMQHLENHDGSTEDDLIYITFLADVVIDKTGKPYRVKLQEALINGKIRN